MERRKYKRVKTLTFVVYSDGKRFLKEFAYNISLHGLMITSRKSSKIGDSIEMSIDTNDPIKAKGKVVWVEKKDRSYNIGVQLKSIEKKAAERWYRFLNFPMAMAEA